MKSAIIQWCFLLSLFSLALGGTFIHDIFDQNQHKMKDQLTIYEESGYGFGLKRSPYGFDGFGQRNGKKNRKTTDPKSKKTDSGGAEVKIKGYGDGYASKADKKEYKKETYDTEKSPSKPFGTENINKEARNPDIVNKNHEIQDHLAKNKNDHQKLDDGYYGYGYSDYGKGYGDSYGKGYGDSYGKGYGDDYYGKGYGDDYYGKGYGGHGKGSSGLGHGILHVSYHKPIAKFIHLKSKHH